MRQVSQLLTCLIAVILIEIEAHYNPPGVPFQQYENALPTAVPQFNPPERVAPGVPKSQYRHYQQAAPPHAQGQGQPQVQQPHGQGQPQVQQPHGQGQPQGQPHGQANLHNQQNQYQQQQVPQQHHQQQHQQQHYQGHNGGSHQQVLNTANIEHERAHIQEHIQVPVDTSKMSEAELQFHYFKMHDTDNNNKLDGCELIKSLIHWHEQGGKDQHAHDPNIPQATEKIFSDEELVALIDPILQMDDLSQDGFIDYPEFIKAQQKAASHHQQQQQQQQQQQHQQEQQPQQHQRS